LASNKKRRRESQDQRRKTDGIRYNGEFDLYISIEEKGVTGAIRPDACQPRFGRKWYEIIVLEIVW
jgi:hypothetical protein